MLRWPGREELIEIIDKQMTFLQVCCTCLIIATHVCATRVRATRSGHFDVACPPVCLCLPLVIFIAQHFSDTCGKIIVQQIFGYMPFMRVSICNC